MKITSPQRIIDLFDAGARLTVDDIVGMTALTRRQVRKAVAMHMRRDNLASTGTRPAIYWATANAPPPNPDAKRKAGSIVAQALLVQPNSVFDLARVLQ